MVFQGLRHTGTTIGMNTREQYRVLIGGLTYCASERLANIGRVTLQILVQTTARIHNCGIIMYFFLSRGHDGGGGGGDL